jgi:tRNA modification GTPase
MRGGIGSEVGPLRERLLSLLTALEAAIDFGDEDDVPEAKPEQVAERVDDIVYGLGALLRSFEAGRRFRDGATVAIAAWRTWEVPPLNRLAGEERAIVDETPGTTRDYQQAEVSVGGIPVLLVDTAGLRRTEDPVERKGVLRSRDAIARADLVLFVLDGGRAVGEGDREAFREAAGRPHLLVVNKSDLPAVATGEELSGEKEGRGIVRVSAKTGEGIGSLVAAVARELAPSEGAVGAQSSPDPRAAPLRGGEGDLALRWAKASAAAGLSPEFPAADVREASARPFGSAGRGGPPRRCSTRCSAVFASASSRW